MAGAAWAMVLTKKHKGDHQCSAGFLLLPFLCDRFSSVCTFVCECGQRTAGTGPYFPCCWLDSLVHHWDVPVSVLHLLVETLGYRFFACCIFPPVGSGAPNSCPYACKGNALSDKPSLQTPFSLPYSVWAPSPWSGAAHIPGAPLLLNWPANTLKDTTGGVLISSPGVCSQISSYSVT